MERKLSSHKDTVSISIDNLDESLSYLDLSNMMRVLTLAPHFVVFSMASIASNCNLSHQSQSKPYTHLFKCLPPALNDAIGDLDGRHSS